MIFCGFGALPYDDPADYIEPRPAAAAAQYPGSTHIRAVLASKDSPLTNGINWNY
jgi:hypothetical protein